MIFISYFNPRNAQMEAQVRSIELPVYGLLIVIGGMAMLSMLWYLGFHYWVPSCSRRHCMGRSPKAIANRMVMERGYKLFGIVYGSVIWSTSVDSGLN